jgi:hypothetical protein
MPLSLSGTEPFTQCSKKANWVHQTLCVGLRSEERRGQPVGPRHMLGVERGDPITFLRPGAGQPFRQARQRLPDIAQQRDIA